MNRLLLTSLLLTFFYFKSFSQMTLLFCYDNAGNQISKAICSHDCFVGDFCSTQSSKLSSKKGKESLNYEIKSDIDIENKFVLFPNPTDDIVKLSWTEDVDELIYSIEIVGMSSPYFKQIPKSKKKTHIELNISNEFTGLYIFKITLNDGTVIHKKLIKQ